jgi:hypothetical protein
MFTLTSLYTSLYAFFDFNFSMLPEEMAALTGSTYYGSLTVGVEELRTLFVSFVPDLVLRVCRGIT